MSKILITGVAGFIGSSTAKKLIKNHTIVGLDNFNNYYDPKIKEENIKFLKKNKKFILYRDDILDRKKIFDIFKKNKPDIVIHLAAMCGVRSSLQQEDIYYKTNVTGTRNILDAAKNVKIKQIIFSSSSSVYGDSIPSPFDESANNLIQKNPYGKSKYLAEKICYEYTKRYNLPILIFRFFTVYGPHGRPDMAPYIFTTAVKNGKIITQYGNGDSERDYTYISDIVDGINLAIRKKTINQIINLGNSKSIKLSTFISLIEKITLKKAKVKVLPRNKYEMKKTLANIQKAKAELGWKPKISTKEGLKRLSKWMDDESIT